MLITFIIMHALIMLAAYGIGLITSALWGCGERKDAIIVAVLCILLLIAMSAMFSIVAAESFRIAG